MGGFPVFAGAPRFRLAAHSATARPFDDFANPEYGFACADQFGRHISNLLRQYGENHTNAAVERAGHFAWFNIALCLQERHQARLFPAVDIDHSMRAFGQHTRDVFQQTATRDVGQRIDFAAADRRQQALHINAGGFDQGIDQEHVLIEQRGSIQLPALVLGQAAHQRIAVGVDARAGEAQQNMARCNFVPGQLFAAFDSADAETGKIVIALSIHARHFCRFATDKGTTGNLATFSNACNDAFGNAVVELPGGKIVEDEQRFCPLHDQVVDAHRDQIDTDLVVSIMIDGQFDLGAYAVVRRDQQGIIVPCGLGIEEPAEATNLRVRTRTGRGFDHGADGFDQRVTGCNRNACFGVAIGCLVAHLARLTLSGLEIQACLGKRLSVFPMPHSITILSPAQSRRPILWIGMAVLAILLVFLGRAALQAQVDGDRGIAPVVSNGDISIGGIDVDVTGKNAEEARENGWKMAQKLGWKKLGGPDMAESQLDSMVSAIVVEKEQIGPHRYIAKLGVVFDRARAGQFMAANGPLSRSAPMLLIPVLDSGGVQTVYEVRNPWQKAWAEFQTGASAIDYARASGAGGDSLLLTNGQISRRSRLWWSNILDQFSAADVLMAIARLERTYPGGPVKGHFTARMGPDSRYLESFTLTAKDEAGVPAMFNQALTRFDGIYTQALHNGLLQPDPTLRTQKLEIDPVLAGLIDAARKAQAASLAPVDAVSVAVPLAETPKAVTPTAPTRPVANFTVQFSSPDAASVDAALGSARGTAGVQGASTSSIAVGGVSVMRVSYAGSLSELAAALRARGWQVSEGANALSIRR